MKPKNNSVKCKWDVRFDYIPGDGCPFQASVILALPTEQANCIPKALRNYDVIVLGEHLSKGWGNIPANVLFGDDAGAYEGYRLREETMRSSKSWDDLLKKVKRAKTEAQEKLSGVIQTNIDNYMNKPKDISTTLKVS